MTDLTRAAWADAPADAVHPTWALGEDAFYESGREQARLVQLAWQQFGKGAGGGIAPRVLDYGAGPGRLSVHLARWAGTVMAEEPNLGYRKQLRRRAAAEGLTNLEITEEGSKTFDLVVCYCLLIHYPPPQAARMVAELARRAPLLALQLPIYPEARWGRSWTDVSVWTSDMLAVTAGALDLDVLSAPVNPEPFTYENPGPHHGDPVVLRRRDARSKRPCCGGG